MTRCGPARAGHDRACQEQQGRPDSAIALLEPAQGRTLRVLIEDERAAYPSTITVAGIEAVAGERIWYPYAAGSFGAEMMF